MTTFKTRGSGGSATRRPGNSLFAEPIPDGVPLVMPVLAAAKLMGLGKSKVYELMGSGRLEYVKVDRARRIPRSAVVQFLERQCVERIVD